MYIVESAPIMSRTLEWPLIQNHGYTITFSRTNCSRSIFPADTCYTGIDLLLRDRAIIADHLF